MFGHFLRGISSFRGRRDLAPEEEVWFPRLVLPSRRRVVQVAVLLIGSALACGNSRNDDDDLREDVLFCEDALAKLDKCCPGFRTQDVSCDHHYTNESGCGFTQRTEIDPAITVRSARCIQDASCEQLVNTKVCERAQSVKPRRFHVSTGGTGGGIIGGFGGFGGFGGSAGSAGKGGFGGGSGTSSTDSPTEVCP